MSLPPYPGYRDSCLPRLGALPSHWKTAPIKAVASWNDEVLAEGTALDYELEYIEISDARAGLGLTGSTTYSFSEAPSRARRKVRDGDILVSTVRTYLRAISKIDNPPDNLIASTGFAVLRPREMEPGFLGYAIESEAIINEIIARSVGVSYPAINASDLVRIELPVPPASEQAAISAVLDRETAKIDALVEEQRLLIELLKEKRQAVISHAVTKGLDPTAPMKDSGVEWLGEVPAHWEVKPLKQLAAAGTSITYGIVQAGPDIPDGIPYIRTSDMSGDELPAEGYLRTTPEIDDAYSRSRVFAGDLVIAIRATIGKPLMVPPRLQGANLTQGTAKFSPGPAVSGHYIQLVLSSVGASAEFERVAKGATFKEITLDMLRRFRVPVPPLVDQYAICDWAEKEGRVLLDLEKAATEAEALLKERRSALISAAVTGKIDVRPAQADHAESA